MIQVLGGQRYATNVFFSGGGLEPPEEEEPPNEDQWQPLGEKGQKIRFRVGKWLRELQNCWPLLLAIVAMNPISGVGNCPILGILDIT